MASRRSLTTTTAAAGALLAALCFVPSASATVEHPERPASAAARTVQPARAHTATATSSGLNLADTGSIDTTPYLVGGTAFLGIGAALVVFSRRRALTLG